MHCKQAQLLPGRGGVSPGPMAGSGCQRSHSSSYCNPSSLSITFGAGHFVTRTVWETLECLDSPEPQEKKAGG
ncbi:hypothetical protein P4O66_012641 [Electrophorus voltai]|uniref:Uncharacterized protein n=1 Tax=Electrophorus voltai TaxID=2609070 RepID=A0AAD8Z3Z9_9TELE|nr:hypothetical protein P4O66_012641 [Electrophorus voltai]